MGWATSSGWRWDSGIAVRGVQSLYTVRCGNGVFLSLGVYKLCGGGAGGMLVDLHDKHESLLISRPHNRAVSCLSISTLSSC